MAENSIFKSIILMSVLFAGLTEIKHEIKDQVRHLPDGHRGSLAAVVERPPYKLIPSDEKKVKD